MFERYKKLMRPISVLVAMSIAASGVACCLPIEAQGLLGHPNKKALFYAVVRGVQCEIRKAVYEQVNDSKFGDRLDWLRHWSSLMHFKFTFDTMGSFNPGVTFHTPNLPLAHVWHAPDIFEDQTMTLPRNAPQGYDFSLGAGVSADAVRVEDVEFFYPFNKDYWARAERDPPGEGCYHIGGFTIGGDLKLRDWLDDVLEPIKRCAFIGVPARQSPVVPILGYDIGAESEESECPKRYIRDLGYSKDNPIKTFSHDVSFIIEFSANATPAWNLVRISSSTAPLFAARRKDAFELSITLGSPDTETMIARKEQGDWVHYLPVGSVRPSQSMINRDLSMQIGSAVRDALRQ